MLPRNIVSAISRARSGHYSLFRIKLVNSPICNSNTAVQDLNHIVWQCPLLEAHRLQMTKELGKMGWQLPLRLDMFLGKPNIQELKTIFKFQQKYNISI